MTPLRFIRSVRARQASRIVGATLLIVAALTCTFRIARITTTPTATGSAMHRVTVERGVLRLERNAGPTPAARTRRILNWQVDPGFRFETHRTVQRRWPALQGGVITQHTREVGVAVLLASTGALLLLAGLIGRKAPGRCRCGYDLSGLSGPRCPECGATVVRHASSSD